MLRQIQEQSLSCPKVTNSWWLTYLEELLPRQHRLLTGHLCPGS